MSNHFSRTNDHRTSTLRNFVLAAADSVAKTGTEIVAKNSVHFRSFIA